MPIIKQVVRTGHSPPDHPLQYSVLLVALWCRSRLYDVRPHPSQTTTRARRSAPLKPTILLKIHRNPSHPSPHHPPFHSGAPIRRSYGRHIPRDGILDLLSLGPATWTNCQFLAWITMRCRTHGISGVGLIELMLYDALASSTNFLLEPAT